MNKNQSSLHEVYLKSIKDLTDVSKGLIVHLQEQNDIEIIMFKRDKNKYPVY